MTDVAKWLDDVFSVPTDGSNIDNNDDDAQDNAFAEIGKVVDNVSYDNKAAKIKEAIAVPSSESYEFVDKIDGGETHAKTAKEERTTVPLPISSKENKECEDTEMVLEQAISDSIMQPDSGEENESDVRVEPDGSPITQEAPVGEDDDDWLITCSSSKLKTFYEHKASKVKRLKKIGLIPFDKYQSELKQAFVPIWNQTDDTTVVNEKIKMIADWRNRVTQITLEVDPQLAWWSMVVEHMQGLLAMTQYEKPKERQVGMHYLHLRDMEYYLGRLKGLKFNCISVMNNLDKAYDSLSRQITVIMPQRELERYSANPVPVYSSPIKKADLTDAPVKNNSFIEEPPFNVKTVDNKYNKPCDILSDFDELSSDNIGVKDNNKKKDLPINRGVKKVSWGDIGNKK